jgi:hypothetical protein
VKNKLPDLRDHLFATLEELRDKDHPMDLERAKTIAGVAQTIINSATVEVKFINAIGGKGSGFIPESPPALPNPDAQRDDRVHRIK